MNRNILVTGAYGQLGSEIQKISKDYVSYSFYFTDVSDLDITNKEAIQDFVYTNQISVIINCAAYTLVDKAETEVALANRINNNAVQYISEIAYANNIALIHISTDYVFDGKGHKPYLPNDPTKPVNYYGVSKRRGEQAMLKINPSNSLIIRTSWVYSSFGNNFVKTMINLGKNRESLNVIYDQVGVPTYARDLARFILNRAIHFENNDVKIYHYTNEGVCSWYDFAREIMDLANLECEVNPISSDDYPTIAKRPQYSLMDKESLKSDFNTQIPYWKSSLKDCINLFKNNNG